MIEPSPPTARVALERPPPAVGASDALLDALERAVQEQSAATGAPVGAVLALDASGLRRARAAGVPVRIALLAGLSIDFPGGLDDATHALVGDLALVPYVARPGLTVASVGPLLPTPGALPPSAPSSEGGGSPGVPATVAFAYRETRAELRRRLGLTDEARVVALRAPELRDVGFMPVFLQVELCALPVALWIDVGDDDAVAARLRAVLPGHAVDAWLVGAGAWPQALAAADVALVRASGPGATESLAVGTPVLALPSDEGRAEQAARAALAALESLQPPATLATLAVALDAALGGNAPERARAALASRDFAGVPARAVAYAARALADAPRPRRSTCVGLPEGFERVAWREDAAARASGLAVSSAAASDDVSAMSPGERAVARAASERRFPTPPVDGDLDARVEAELAALKARLREESG